jgi:restriction system protein
MPDRSIPAAVIEALRMTGRAMTIREIYNCIVENNLYHFNSDKPLTIVTRAIRRHCENVEINDSASIKYFIHFSKEGTYWLQDLLQFPPTTETATALVKENNVKRDLYSLHKLYLDDFQDRLLQQIKDLDPRGFELFSKKVLEAYGFQEVHVTRKSKDGGIDGYGKLKVGLAYLRAAFQSKHWKNSVGRPEIDRFRGAIQGKYEQGYLFTTSTFTPGAQEVSFQPGAVPVILIDGSALLDIIINKQIGIEVEHLPLYSSALDLLINDEDSE